jgi:hypothetical protein
LQQSGLNYQELLDLLDNVFINPLNVVNDGGGGGGDGSGERKVRTIRISSTDPSDPYTSETAKLQLIGFDGVNSASNCGMIGQCVTLTGQSLPLILIQMGR